MENNTQTILLSSYLQHISNEQLHILAKDIIEMDSGNVVDLLIDKLSNSKTFTISRHKYTIGSHVKIQKTDIYIPTDELAIIKKIGLSDNVHIYGKIHDYNPFKPNYINISFGQFITSVYYNNIEILEDVSIDDTPDTEPEILETETPDELF